MVGREPAATSANRFKNRAISARTRLYEILSNKKVLAGLTILPAALLFLMINLLPIAWAIAAGFFQIHPLSPDWNFQGIDNYTNILSNDSFWMAVWRSVIFAAGSVGLQLTVGTVIALYLNRSFRGDLFVRSIIMLPYLTPTAILAFIGLWMGNSQFGIINQLLFQLGLIGEYIPWFGSTDLAMLSIILTSSWKFTMFVTIMVLARLQGIPEGFYEAASVAGATPFQQFRDITLPRLKGVIFIVVLLRGLWMFNKFDIIYVLTGGGPLDATEVVSIFIFQTAFSRNQLGVAAATSTLLFILLIGVALLYFRVLEPSKEVKVE